jgi:hypothetical protein
MFTKEQRRIYDRNRNLVKRIEARPKLTPAELAAIRKRLIADRERAMGELETIARSWVRHA